MTSLSNSSSSPSFETSQVSLSKTVSSKSLLLNKKLFLAPPLVDQFVALALGNDVNTTESVDGKLSKVSMANGVNQANDNLLKQCNIKSQHQLSFRSTIKTQSNKTFKKGVTHRRIRKIKTTAELTAKSQVAVQTEKDRRKRVEAKQAQLAELFNVSQEVVLDFDPQTKQPLVQVHPAIVPLMKPHQVDGVRFMYDCVIETEQRLKNDPKGTGCILAHSMGLGKTFQVIVFLHTALTNPDISEKLRRVLIVVPYNVIENWASEFRKWLEQCELSLPVRLFEMRTAKTKSKRVNLLNRWHQNGGIMLISISNFRHMLIANLCEATTQVYKRCFLKPGPDLAIFDEGHQLKNDESLINMCVSQIETGRRVILTGTPLQNNLAEFFVMLHVVKPCFLGNKDEFKNRFKNPIENGQHKDSSANDVKLMKRRIYVLNQMLQGCIHRCAYNVLTPFLKPKQEYVLMVKLSQEQIALYRHFLECFAGKSIKYLFRDKCIIDLICSHPALLHNYYEKCAETKSKLYMAKLGPQWYRQLVPLKAIYNIQLSSKFELIFSVIEQCDSVGDKLVIFSQSLMTLDLMQQFLQEKDWRQDHDYYRMDGNVNSERRTAMIDEFNQAANRRARLMLVSTRAGGIGVNLVGANRVVIFDSSFNPTNDVQAIFRVYRLGQQKPVFVYRFVAFGTMEEKIYKRQVVKQSLSGRVVDEHHVARHFTKSDVIDLYRLTTDYDQATLLPPQNDSMLSNILAQHSHQIVAYHQHDSLLENLPENDLSDGEQEQAWNEVGVNMMEHLSE